MALEYTYLAAAIEIVTGENDVIIYREDGAAPDITGTVAAGTYYLYGDGTEASDILLAVCTALANGAGGAGHNYTVTSALARASDSALPYAWTITTDGTSFLFRGADVLTTFPLAAIGLPATNGGFASTQSSTLVPTHVWLGDQPSATRDILGLERVVVQHRTPNGQRYTATIASATEQRHLRWEHLSTQQTLGDAGTYDGRAFRYFWGLVSDGRPVRVYRESISSGATLNTMSSADLLGTYVLDEDSCNSWRPERSDGRSPLYGFEIGLEEYVA